MQRITIKKTLSECNENLQTYILDTQAWENSLNVLLLFQSRNDSQINLERKSPSEEEESGNDDIKPKPSKKKPSARKLTALKQELEEDEEGEQEFKTGQEGWFPL